MIVLRNEQLDIFRADSRKKLPERIRRGLVKQGLRVEQQDGALVLRDSRQQPTRLTFAPDGLPASIVRWCCCKRVRAAKLRSVMQRAVQMRE